jgi:hypothetical protein
MKLASHTQCAWKASLDTHTIISQIDFYR